MRKTDTKTREMKRSSDTEKGEQEKVREKKVHMLNSILFYFCVSIVDHLFLWLVCFFSL